MIYFIFIALNAFDCHMTYMALKNTNIREANPIMAWTMEQIGLEMTLTMKFAVTAICAWLFYSTRNVKYHLPIMYGVVGIYFLVAFYHVYLYTMYLD